MIRYAWRDLLHNPRRTVAALVGVALGVGLFSGVLFFIDGSAATMTARALAPLALDTQRIVTASASGLTLEERIDGAGALDPGDRVTVALTVRNDGVAPANDVVVRDEPPASLTYVADTTVVDGVPTPDVEGDSPLSHGVAGFGMNLGRLAPGGSVRVAYTAGATEAVTDVATLRPSGTVSSREEPEPIAANAARVLSPAELAERIAAVPGVAAADVLAMVDLPVASLGADGATVGEPVRVFAFDEGYAARYTSIRIVDGSFGGEGVIISVEAAQALGVGAGDRISLALPGRDEPLGLTVRGIVDLARAEPLFSSRKAHKLEEFLYVANTVVVPPGTFRDEIVPAFERQRAEVGLVTKSFPVSEVDVLVDRSALASDPATAYRTTTAITEAIDRIAPGQGYTIDNISNTLAVAAEDAAAGRRMFLFLGLPGALLAGLLAAYAGDMLATAERRERATLRLRGADRGHLRTIALTKALAISCAGSAIGLLLGLASAAVILGGSALRTASASALLASAGWAAALGAVITAIALFLPARRSIRRAVVDERRELRVARAPRWRRWSVDVALLVVAVLIEVTAIRGGALEPPTGSVYAGLAVTLPTRLMPAPILVWIGGVLLVVRLLLALAGGGEPVAGDRFGPSVGGILRRGLRRRAGDLAGGVVALGLVVAFAVSIALFAGTYQATKADDARFTLGADLRITPSVLTSHRPGADDAWRFEAPGVTAISPMVFGLENSVLIGPVNQQRKNLAAIDPSTLVGAASLPDEAFVDDTGTDELAALQERPTGALIDEETADDLSVDVGDPVEIILALGTNREVQARFRVVGLFQRFPGTPVGANLVVRLDRYRALTGIRPVDFFLAGVRAHDAGVAQHAADAIVTGPGARTPVHVETAATTLGRDQSSLTAVNVRGLVRMNAVYALALSATAIAIFVFGLLLQRRREYVTLRAQGLRIRDIRTLVVMEALVVSVCGLVAGSLVGIVMAGLSIETLRGLFVLTPRLTVPFGPLVAVGVAVLGAALCSAVIASGMIGRLSPTEILREE